MLNQRDIARLKRTVESLEPPVLSIYLPIEPNAGGLGPAATVKLNNALRQVHAPPEIAEAVRRQVADLHGAGTALVFANRDRALAQAVDVEIPEGSDSAPPSAWGAPLWAPFCWVLGSDRFGLIFVDGTGVRFIEAYLGDAEERWTDYLGFIRGDDDQLRQSKPIHPAYIPDRGGGAKDAAENHAAVWTEKFLRQVATRVGETVAERGIDRLIVLGPEGTTQKLVHVLPRPLADRVAAQLSSMPRRDAKPREILDHCRQAIAADRERRARALLAEIAERGISGVKECRRALWMGRIETVAIAWQLDENTRESAIREALAHGTDVWVLERDIGEELMREHGGLAGVPRW